jgi:adenylate cyclase
MAGREGMAFLLGPDRKLLASSETKFSDAAVEGQPSPSLADRSIFEALAPYLASKQAGAWDIDDSAFGGRAFLNVTPVGLQGWTVGTLLSERAFAGDILAERRRMLMASAAALALVALLAVVVTRRLFVAPLQAASRELKRFRRFELAGRRPLRSNIAEVAELGRGLESARQSLLAFSRYAPTELARKLMADAGHGEQAVERGTITILFLDLEGFTAATERLGHRLAPQLNAFLAAMTDEVREAGGTVDKFIGDAVMALFGAPDADEEHALNACKAALGCITALERLNKGWAEAGLPTFRMRIGVNTGRVLVGSIGAPDRLNYTAIGDPVNLAARLESLNREYGTRIMLGAQTFDLVKYDIAARRLDAVRVKGKTERVPVYELLELALGGARIEPAEWVKRYEAGLDALHDGQPEVARRCFLEVTETRGADPASAAMLARLPVPARDPAFDKLEEAAAAFSGRAAGG